MAEIAKKFLDLDGLKALVAQINQKINIAKSEATAPDATTTTKGVVSVGDGLQVNSGKVSVDGSKFKTVNGTSVYGEGAITIDLSLYKVVESLPTSGVDANKIYLVKSATEGENDIYTEYMYVNSKWEKLGEYKTAIDLTPYAKEADLTALSGKVTTAEGKISTLETNTQSVTSRVDSIEEDIANNFINESTIADTYVAQKNLVAVTNAEIEALFK